MESNALQNDGVTSVLAEESHSGRIWSLVILLALIVPVASVALRPTAPARFALVLVGVIGVGTFAMAWSGFQYRFLQHAVEIRMLGFRLRSIPRSAIVTYSIETWAFIRGYGIRGMGNTRAYVWGNKVVHIKTTTGDIYISHDDPERIVRDLDMVMGVLTRG